MIKNSDVQVISSCLRGRFLFLLISILLLLILSPLLDNFIGLKFLLNIFMTAIFISGVYAVSQKKIYMLITAALAIPMLASLWSAYFIKIPYFQLTGQICGVLCMAFMVIIILSHIIRVKNVTADVIFGAIVVYLLMALMWSFMYSVVEDLHPGSFIIPEGPIKDSRFLFTYFSFVTLATLGYGDVTPLTAPACSLSIIEAIIGQIYLVVVVAWLVGMFVSQSLVKNTRYNVINHKREKV
ncbi:MAG: two pore domain potassium channel family protein [Deltaproteobacteria bacterium]|nr:two pore domain potassium channel family protein [Deltaproteobacteria bacterium]